MIIHLLEGAGRPFWLWISMTICPTGVRLHGIYVLCPTHKFNYWVWVVHYHERRSLTAGQMFCVCVWLLWLTWCVFDWNNSLTACEMMGFCCSLRWQHCFWLCVFGWIAHCQTWLFQWEKALYINQVMCPGSCWFLWNSLHIGWIQISMVTKQVLFFVTQSTDGPLW